MQEQFIAPVVEMAASELTVSVVKESVFSTAKNAVVDVVKSNPIVSGIAIGTAATLFVGWGVNKYLKHRAAKTNPVTTAAVKATEAGCQVTVDGQAVTVKTAG